MPTALVLTSAPAVTLQQLQTLLEAQGLSSAEQVAVATGSGSLATGSLAAAAYDSVVSVATSQGHHSVALLGQLVAALKPGGRLVVQEVRGGGWGGGGVAAVLELVKHLQGMGKHAGSPFEL